MKQLSAILIFTLSIGVYPAWAEQVIHNLSWKAPIVRSDLTPLLLSEIGGFKVYADDGDGTNLLPVLDVNEGTATSVSLTYDLPPNVDTTIYYAVTAYDTDGRESAFSVVIPKTSNPLSSASPAEPQGFAVGDACARGCDQAL